MRAGLLSQPRVIEEINSKFVSTWILVDDAKRLAEAGDPLAGTLASNWEFPVEMMFVTSDGKLLRRLNSDKDFKDVHPDVSIPGTSYLPNGIIRPPHVDVFFQHANEVLAIK